MRDLGSEVALASGTFNHHAHAIADMIDERSAYVAPNGQETPSARIASVHTPPLARLDSCLLIIHRSQPTGDGTKKKKHARFETDSTKLR